MRNGDISAKAAVGATVGFAGLAVFQLLLAAGAPFGEAAWGGTAEGQLPTGLRVGSGIAIVVYTAAAALLLRRTGFLVRWFSPAVARIGSWVLMVLLTLGALANLLSRSPWERFVLGPITLGLAGLCLVVARSAEDTAGSVFDEPDRLQAAHHTNRPPARKWRPATSITRDAGLAHGQRGGAPDRSAEVPEMLAVVPGRGALEPKPSAPGDVTSCLDTDRGAATGIADLAEPASDGRRPPLGQRLSGP